MASDNSYTQTPDDLLVLNAADVEELLNDQHDTLFQIVSRTYKAHAQSETSLPHSVFLRFPDHPKNRIIGLPAYMGTDESVAGMKWVASFPENLHHNLPRASATLILNDTQTGRPICFMEASAINLKRTAASAALAARLVLSAQPTALTLIGCGPINAEICAFIAHSTPALATIHLYDIDQAAAHLLARNVKKSGKHAIVHKDFRQACQATQFISFATSATTPYVDDSSVFLPQTVVLHISLRDIKPTILVNASNVVDDPDHVMREATSIQLAAEQAGNTDFIEATIGELITTSNAFVPKTQLTIVSPFGLGILDVAVARYVYEQAKIKARGTIIKDFSAGRIQ